MALVRLTSLFALVIVLLFAQWSHGAPDLIANSNLNFYVTPTGSDAGQCTQAAPCAKIQRAVNVAALYFYQSIYGFTINVADGTCNDTANTSINLWNIPSAYYDTITGDLTTPGNAVCPAYFGLDVGAQWTVQGFKLTGTYGAFVTNIGDYLTITNIDFAGNYSAGAIVSYGGFVNADQGTFTISSSMSYFVWDYIGGAASDATFDFDNTVITFTNSPVFSGAFLYLTQAQFQFNRTFSNTEFVNTSTVTGVKAILNNFSHIAVAGGTADGTALTRANFPGNSPILFPQGISTFSGDPTVYAQLPAANAVSADLTQTINDCPTQTPGATVTTGGGGYICKLWSDHTNWRVLGAN